MFPAENINLASKTALDEEETLLRRDSFNLECDEEIKDLIQNEIMKRISRIYSVQFHNIATEEVHGKIV